MSVAIPPASESEVLAKAGEGWTTRRISQWLKDEKGIEASHATVAKLLAKARSFRADVAKVVVREELGKTLLTDLEHLEAIRADLAERAKECLLPADVNGQRIVNPMAFTAYLKTRELEVKVIDRKLHYAGADEEGEKKTRFVFEVPAKAETSKD